MDTVFDLKLELILCSAGRLQRGLFFIEPQLLHLLLAPAPAFLPLNKWFLELLWSGPRHLELITLSFLLLQLAHHGLTLDLQFGFMAWPHHLPLVSEGGLHPVTLCYPVFMDSSTLEGTPAVACHVGQCCQPEIQYTDTLSPQWRKKYLAILTKYVTIWKQVSNLWNDL